MIYLLAQELRYYELQMALKTDFPRENKVAVCVAKNGGC